MTEKPNLITKLVEVMDSINRIAKRGKNTFHNYTYATEMDILEAVRSELAKRNVFVSTTIKEKEVTEYQTDKGKLARLTQITTSHTFINGDRPEEKMTVSSYGQGDDQGDKGGYKAITGAMKYFLMKTFLIPTGDDPENDGETPVKRPKESSKSHRSDVEDDEDEETSVEDD